MRNKGIKRKILGGVLSLGLAAGCANDGSLRDYTLSNSFERTPVSSYDSRKEFYDSIGPKVTRSEADYIEKFKKMPTEDRQSLLNDGLLDDFSFLNRDNPGTADLVFLKSIEDSINAGHLKGF